MKKTKEDNSVYKNAQNHVDQILREFEMCCDEAILRREGKRLIIEPKKRQRSVSVRLEHLNNDFPNVDITLFGDFRV